MHQEDLNRLRMLRATATHLEAIQPIWRANPIMQEEVAELRQLISGIEEAHARTMTAAGKEERVVAGNRRESAITAMMVLVNTTRSWAERVGTEELLAQRLGARPYVLRSLSVARFIARMEEMYELCNGCRANLPESSLSAEDYRNARACLDAFVALQDTPRQSDVGRQGENLNLQDLFKKTTPVLKRLDRLMENVQSRYKVECAKYRVARTIYDYGIGRKKAKSEEPDETSKPAAKGSASKPASKESSSKPASQAAKPTQPDQSTQASQPGESAPSIQPVQPGETPQSTQPGLSIPAPAPDTKSEAPEEKMAS